MKIKNKFWNVLAFTMGVALFLLGSCEKASGIRDDPGNLTEFRGHNEVIYEFRVLGDLSGSVWGGADGIYTDDSDLSTAAVHAGELAPGERDVVKVTILPGRDIYIGSVQNGVVSGDYGTWYGSFQFEQ